MRTEGALPMNNPAQQSYQLYIGGEWVDVIAVEDLTGPQGEKGEQGEQGPQGEPGKDAPEPEGGCGSSIGAGTAVMVSALLGLACISIFVVKAAAKRR